MIFVGTSVGLAHLLAEDRQPPAALWDEVLIASRLIEYEIWTRLNAYGLAESHAEVAREIIRRIGMLEMSSAVLERAVRAFPLLVRTLDALHLATFDFVWCQDHAVQLASCDRRMAKVARMMGLPLLDLSLS